MDAWTGELQDVDTNDGRFRIFVRRTGAPSGQPTLFLHGFPTSSLDWSRIARHFADRDCLFVDLLGFGHSDKPALRYSYGLQADIIERLLRDLGLSAVDIVAHDYAVTLTQELLRRWRAGAAHALRPGRVVLLNGGVFGRLHRPRAIQHLLRMPWLGRAIARRLPAGALTRSLNAIAGRADAWSASDGERHWQAIAANDGLRRLPQLLHYIADRRADGGKWEAAMIAAAPSIGFVWGPADPVSGAHMIAEVERRMQQSRIIALDGVGHYPQWEAPERTAAAIRTLLEPRR